MENIHFFFSIFTFSCVLDFQLTKFSSVWSCRHRGLLKTPYVPFSKSKSKLKLKFHFTGECVTIKIYHWLMNQVSVQPIWRRTKISRCLTQLSRNNCKTPIQQRSHTPRVESGKKSQRGLTRIKTSQVPFATPFSVRLRLATNRNESSSAKSRAAIYLLVSSPRVVGHRAWQSFLTRTLKSASRVMIADGWASVPQQRIFREKNQTTRLCYTKSLSLIFTERIVRESIDKSNRERNRSWVGHVCYESLQLWESNNYGRILFIWICRAIN